MRALPDAKGRRQDKSNTPSQRRTTTAARKQAQHRSGSRPPPVAPALALGTPVTSRLPCLGTPRATSPSKPDLDHRTADLLALETAMLRLPGHGGFALWPQCPRSLGQVPSIPPSSSRAQREGTAKPPPGGLQSCPVQCALALTPVPSLPGNTRTVHVVSTTLLNPPISKLWTATATSSARTVWTESSLQQSPACRTRSRREPQTQPGGCLRASSLHPHTLPTTPVSSPDRSTGRTRTPGHQRSPAASLEDRNPGFPCLRCGAQRARGSLRDTVGHPQTPRPYIQHRGLGPRYPLGWTDGKLPLGAMGGPR